MYVTTYVAKFPNMNVSSEKYYNINKLIKLKTLKKKIILSKVKKYMYHNQLKNINRV